MSVSPLVVTAEAATATLAWITVRVDPGAAAEDGWVRCADLTAADIAAWEGAVAEQLVRQHGRSDPQTAASYVLCWYAAVPSLVGGAFFRLARRVPRLGPCDLAFHRAPQGHPDGVALLDERFWCLPSDPATDDPRATTVADEVRLAGVLRAEVRRHADAFLTWYRPGARLPRRSLLGAFFDGLDTGVGCGGTGWEALAACAAVLPGHTAEFRDATTTFAIVGENGLPRLTRRRLCCCFYYRVADELCETCPRLTRSDRNRPTAAPAR